MAKWSAQNISPSMLVYTLDGHELGHIGKVYEDSFLVHKGYFFPTQLNYDRGHGVHDPFDEENPDKP